MPTRDIVSNPCQDACGEMTTNDVVDGARVYRCPGCDSTWIDTREIGTIPEPEPDASA